MVCTHVVDVDFGKIRLFTGNYTFWYETSQLVARQMADKNKKVEQKRAEMMEFIARFSANASKSKQATSRKKALDKLDLNEMRPSSRRYPFINFRPEREPGDVIFECENLSKLAENGETLFQNISDAEVILHEYTHGLSTRLVGGGVGIGTIQSAGMGEGWSDFYALALLSEPGDDLDAAYPFGAYVSYQLAGLAENYYFGIRRYPYSTDLSKNPLTFKDIDSAQISPHTGVPINPIFGGFNPLNAAEVHSQGSMMSTFTS